MPGSESAMIYLGELEALTMAFASLSTFCSTLLQNVPARMVSAFQLNKGQPYSVSEFFRAVTLPKPIEVDSPNHYNLIPMGRKIIRQIANTGCSVGAGVVTGKTVKERITRETGRLISPC